MTMERQSSQERLAAQKLRAAQDLLESCRPGSSDLADPEMAEAVQALADDPQLRAAFDRVQRQDLLLSRAFQQVEVPGGLEQRLLARLAEAPPTPAEISLTSQSGSSGSESPLPKSSPRFARRKWLVASLAMAGSLLLLFGWFSQRPITPTIDVLASRSLQWTEDLQNLPAESWQEFHESEFPQLRWRPRRWQALPTKLDAEVVVFDFGSTRDRQLLLYQFKTRHTLPLPQIPYQSLTVTGAWQSGAWQEGEHIYVAVTSDARLLESLRRAYSAT